MSGDVVIFGIGEMASLAWYALSHAARVKVVVAWVMPPTVDYRAQPNAPL